MTSKEQLFRTLYKNNESRVAYADSVPMDLPIFDNFYVDSLLMENDLQIEEVFGEHASSILWFLYEWKPGFEIGQGDVVVKIQDIEQFIQYMKDVEGAFR